MNMLESISSDQVFGPVAQHTFDRGRLVAYGALHIDDRYDVRDMLDQGAEPLFALAQHQLFGLQFGDSALQLGGALRYPVFEVLVETLCLFFRPLTWGDVADDGEHQALTNLYLVVDWLNGAKSYFNGDLLAALAQGGQLQHLVRVDIKAVARVAVTGHPCTTLIP